MKKYFALLLAAILLLSLTACKNEDAVPTVEKNEMVERTLDSIYVTDNLHDFLPDEYASANGFESVTVNGDNTITLVMTGEKYNQMLTDISEALRQEIARTPTYDDCEHIQKIEHSDDFSEFTVQVILQDFTADDFAISYLASCAELYRVLVSGDPRVTVTVVDANGTVLGVTVYPESE